MRERDPQLFSEQLPPKATTHTSWSLTILKSIMRNWMPGKKHKTPLVMGRRSIENE
jgi:hypothetical protein